MKKWKRFALVALAAALAALLAAALWRLGGAPRGGTAPSHAAPTPSVSLAPAPSAPASLTPAPSTVETPAPSTAQSPAPSAPAPSAARTPSPTPSAAETPSALPSSAPPQAEETQPAALCTLSVRCDTILSNLDRLDPDKVELVPSDGVLIAETAEEFAAGESAFDLLKRVCERRGVHLEFSITPGYGSAYIEGIGNLYEFDCGDRSGWIYRVNGQVPSKGCSAYTLQAGDSVEFLYTCDWGGDL